MKPEAEDMLPEYNLDRLGKPEVGKYHERLRDRVLVYSVSADLAAKFPDSESVDRALREYSQLRKVSASAECRTHALKNHCPRG